MPPQLNRRLSDYGKNPYVWVGGAALAAVVTVSASRGPAPRTAAPNFFPTDERPMTASVDERGGLAPGSPYGTTFQDSLAMLAGEKPTPPAAAPAEKTGGDFIEALNDVAEKPGKTKPMSFMGKLTGSLSGLTGGSGSGSSGAGFKLAALDSDAYNLRQQNGPGAMASLKGDRDFKQVYGMNTVNGGNKVNERGDGLLSIAQGKAANLFNNLKPGSLDPKGPDAKPDLTGISADGKNKEIPKVPEVDGKEIKRPEDDKKKDQAPAANGQPATPGMPSAGTGASDKKDGTGTNTGSGDGSGGGGQQPSIEVGISPNGLVGDAKAEAEYAKGLQAAGGKAKPGSGVASAPDCSDCIFKDKGDIDKIKKYVGTDVEKAADAGTSAPKAPRGRELNDLGKLAQFKIGETNAQEVVTQAYNALRDAGSKAEEYQKALVNAAEKVKKENKTAEEQSSKIVALIPKLKGGKASLDGLKSGIEADATAWNAATAQPDQGASTKPGIVAAASGKITGYAPKALALVTETEAQSKETSAAHAAARQTEESVKKDMQKADKNYKASLYLLTRRIEALQGNLTLAESSAIAQEGEGTQFQEMKRAVQDSVKDLSAAKAEHETAFNKYRQAKASVEAAIEKLTGNVYEPSKK